jgi:Spy/CpxP family protein refolding chaperone
LISLSGSVGTDPAKFKTKTDQSNRTRRQKMKKSGTKLSGIFVITLATFLLSASLALAGPGGWGRGMGMGHGWYPNTGSLSPEQSQELQVLRENYLKGITPIQNQLFSKRAELRLLWAAADPDKEQILSKQNEINGLQQTLQEMATNYQLTVRDIAGP